MHIHAYTVYIYIYVCVCRNNNLRINIYSIYVCMCIYIYIYTCIITYIDISMIQSVCVCDYIYIDKPCHILPPILSLCESLIRVHPYQVIQVARPMPRAMPNLHPHHPSSSLIPSHRCLIDFHLGEASRDARHIPPSKISKSRSPTSNRGGQAAPQRGVPGAEGGKAPGEVGKLPGAGGTAQRSGDCLEDLWSESTRFWA